MGEGSLWEQERVARRDVPTLQDVFACCDRDVLVRAIVERCALPDRGEGTTSAQERGDMARRVAAVLDDLCSMPVKRKRGRGRLLVPIATYAVEGDGAIVRRMGMRLLLRDEVATPAPAGEGADGPAVARGFCALEPWERLLACRVWLGGPWSAGERYCSLASTFWDMTYFGFTAEDVAAGQRAWRDGPGTVEVPGEGEGFAWCGQVPRGRSSPGAADLRARRAERWGLFVADSLEEDLRSAQLACVAELNRRSEEETMRRFADAVRRMDKRRDGAPGCAAPSGVG